MRSTLSDDLQGIGWWLASDGKWYPPDLHPAARYAATGEQARIAALFDATIGVARVRDKVYAQVHGEVRNGTFSPDERGGAYSGAQNGSADEKSPGRAAGLGRDSDMPRFRGLDRPNWPFEPRSASEPITSKSETRWRPDARQRADSRWPPSRSPSGPDRPAPTPPALERPARAAAVLEPLPRWHPVQPHEPEKPCDQGTTFAPEPLAAPAATREPVSTASAQASASPTVAPPPPTPPPPAPRFAIPQPTSAAPPVVAPPPATTLERIGPPPSARRRPSTIRPTSELREAVAGAVARAAAQGPLMPRGPEESDAEDRPAPQVSEPWAYDERPSAGLATTDAQPAVAPQTPPDAGSRMYDPYDEFVRMAGERALADAVPRRRSNRPPASSLGTSPLQGEEPSDLATESIPAEGAPYAADSDTAQVVSPAPAEPELAASAEPELAASAEPELAASAEPELAASAEPELAASAEPELAASAEPELAASAEPELAASAEPELAASAEPELAAYGEPEPAAPAEPELASSGEQHFPRSSDGEGAAWPIGERRSFARQARKPLPAALQAVVAAEVSQADSGTQASEPLASRQPQAPTPALLGATATSSEQGPAPVTAKKPGIIRRYGSAIAIVVLFVAAAGAAAGIAAFRGPTQPGLTTVAQAQQAANSVVLRTGDFPPPWHVAKTGVTASSYGVAAGLVTPSLVRSWTASNPGCAGDIQSVSAALTASDTSAAAVASTQAAASDPLGGSWQTADVVAIHSDATTVIRDLAAPRSLLTRSAARSCINRFWSASMLAGLPDGSHISLSVAPAALPALPGSPPLWAMSMGGTAVVRGVTLPFRFEVISFAVGHAQVSFTSSSKLAPLPLSLNQALLVVLATRAELQTS